MPRPSMTSPRQLDIFLDSESAQAANALSSALARADVGEARRSLNTLKTVDPSHHWLSHAETLIEALESAPPKTAQDGQEILARIDREWTKAADTIFGAGNHSLLLSIWRAVGESLIGEEFNPDHPNLHPSYAYAKISDWASVEQSIRETPDFSEQSVLLSRIAEAIWHQSRRVESISYWFALCWLVPEVFRSLMEKGAIPDSALRDGWLKGLDEDFEPAPTGPWFPAWMLLLEPGLARRTVEPTGTSVPETAFATLRSLTLGDGADTDLRKRLQKLHPGLLACFLAKR